jgi:peptidyl-prolyl cis-trans isomerase SurA
MRGCKPYFYIKCLLFLSLFVSVRSGFAQQSADKIVAIVGKNRIILQSDLEIEAGQLKQQDPDKWNDSMKCLILQEMITRKMLVEQAERDSVLVSEEEVEAQLDNRVRYFVSLYGSKEKLEQLSGKTIYQMKEEYKETIKEQMITEKIQGQILENVKITPAEIAAFFKKIPADSLPFFPAAVEVGQIVVDPPVSSEMEKYAKDKLDDIRKQITEGNKSFETMAGLYSEDPGSRDNGGRYDGVTRNGPWAAEFIAAAFKLQNGEISPIVKTKFGYHIIKMISRKGDEADLEHILIRPKVTTGDFNIALAKLDSVRSLLIAGKTTFQEAVGRYSTDESAKRTGGMILDPQTGNSVLEMSKLDPAMVLLLDSLQTGHFSKPHIFVTDTRDQSCRIIYLRSRTTPHKANLQDDYGRIQEIALAQKKHEKRNNWVINKLPSIYVWLDNEYKACSAFKDWKIGSSETAVKSKYNY